jgi:PIN domain nuclease of toxin-antitoxin system
LEVKALLDTHAFLWAITNDRRLSRKAQAIFASGQNDLFLSVAGVWEVLIKTQIGKLKLPLPAGPYLRQQMAQNSMQVLPLRLEHVLRLEYLPLHHRDPFDRLLVAQSIEEHLPIVSSDPFLAKYPVSLLW